MKKKVLAVLGVVVVLVLVYWVFSNSGSNLPLSEERRYTEKVNAWLSEKKSVMESVKKNASVSKGEGDESRLKKIASIAEKQIREIEFHGKVIDQYGMPVEGLEVVYDAGSEYLAAGTGVGRTKTSVNGTFRVENAKGSSLIIRELNKKGYEFHLDDSTLLRFESSADKGEPSWEEATRKSPYIFNVWKVNEYPQVKTGDHIFGFTPDGRVSTLDFLERGTEVLKRGEVDGDISVVFDRDEKKWYARFVALNGGLKEHDDRYPNIAPEAGYKERIEYQFNKQDVDRLKKKFYFTSRNGKLYGRVTMEILPYYRDKSAIALEYVVNTENGRELAVK